MYFFVLNLTSTVEFSCHRLDRNQSLEHDTQEEASNVVVGMEIRSHFQMPLWNLNMNLLIEDAILNNVYDPSKQRSA